MEKRCFKCGQTKALDDFYRHPMMADGHLGKCKECTRRDASEREDRLRATDPQWVERERARCVAKQTTYNKVVKKKWPEKYRARIALHNAVAQGRIRKPTRCERCGKKLPRARIQAHHSDYSKPLAVIWACAPCHAVLDGRARPKPRKTSPF